MRDEKVLVVSKHRIFDMLNISEGGVVLKHFQPDQTMNHIISLNTELKVVNRSLCEGDESLLQLIPYVYILDKDIIYVAERTTRGGEDRLYNMKHIGFGGHCRGRAQDYILDTLCDNISRELEEELSDLNNYKYTWKGFLYDGTNPVGRVHLGIVIKLTTSDLIGIKEESHSSGRYIKLEDINDLDKYEGWSKILLEQLKSSESSLWR